VTWHLLLHGSQNGWEKFLNWPVSSGQIVLLQLLFGEHLGHHSLDLCQSSVISAWKAAKVLYNKSSIFLRPLLETWVNSAHHLICIGLTSWICSDPFGCLWYLWCTSNMNMWIVIIAVALPASSGTIRGHADISICFLTTSSRTTVKASDWRCERREASNYWTCDREGCVLSLRWSKCKELLHHLRLGLCCRAECHRAVWLRLVHTSLWVAPSQGHCGWASGPLKTRDLKEYCIQDLSWNHHPKKPWSPQVSYA